MSKWLKRLLSGVAILVSAGAVLLLLAALALYQVGFRPQAVEALNVEVSPWATAESLELKGETLKLLSLHLNFGAGLVPLDVAHGEVVQLAREAVEAQLDLVVELVREEGVDVLALQGVDFGSRFAGGLDQAEYIARKLGFGYVVRGTTWRHPYLPFPDPMEGKMLGAVHAGIAVVSRVPVSAARRLSLPGEKLPNWWSTTFGPSFAVLEVDLMFLGRPLALFVTQLTAGDRLTREKQAQAVAGHIDQPREGKAVLAAALFSTPARKGNDADGRGDYALDLVRHRRNLVTLLGDYEVRADPARYVSFDDGSGEPWLADWILPERGLEVLRFEILDPSPALSSHRPLLLELKP